MRDIDGKMYSVEKPSAADSNQVSYHNINHRSLKGLDAGVP